MPWRIYRLFSFDKKNKEGQVEIEGIRLKGRGKTRQGISQRDVKTLKNRCFASVDRNIRIISIPWKYLSKNSNIENGLLFMSLSFVVAKPGNTNFSIQTSCSSPFRSWTIFYHSINRAGPIRLFEA